MLAIDLSSGAPLAHPGLTQLKLTAEGRQRFAVTGEQRIGEKAKSLCAMDDGAAVGPAALRAIYILATGPELRLELIPPARAAVELVRHTYGYRLLPHIDLAEAHFRQSAALVTAIPVSRLTRPRDLSRLGDTLKLLAT